MGYGVHHTHTAVRCMIVKTQRQVVGHRNIKGYVLGAVMLFEGDYVKLNHIVTITDHSSEWGKSLLVRDKNEMLKCT